MSETGEVHVRTVAMQSMTISLNDLKNIAEGMTEIQEKINEVFDLESFEATFRHSSNDGPNHDVLVDVTMTGGSVVSGPTLTLRPASPIPQT